MITLKGNLPLGSVLVPVLWMNSAENHRIYISKTARFPYAFSSHLEASASSALLSGHFSYPHCIISPVSSLKRNFSLLTQPSTYTQTCKAVIQYLQVIFHSRIFYLFVFLSGSYLVGFRTQSWFCTYSWQALENREGVMSLTQVVFMQCKLIIYCPSHQNSIDNKTFYSKSN